jgi:hypothetical protein
MFFNKKNIVDKTDGSRKGGIVLHVACFLATASGNKLCDKKTCNHSPKEFIWVKWDSGTFSHHQSELVLSSDQNQNKIQSEKKEEQEKLKEAVKTIENKIFDWRLYNGFSKVKFDKKGNAYIKEIIDSNENSPKELKNEEIDWDAYMGFKNGSYRKDKAVD